MLTEENKANTREQERTEGTVVATAACLSSRLTPPSPRGSAEGERGPVSRRCLSVGLCVKEIRTEKERACMRLCVGVSDLCPRVWLSPPRAGQNSTGRRAPNWAQMAATDRDGGGINTLINNYLNNDTGYTGVGGEGGQKDRRWGEKEDMMKTER